MFVALVHLYIRSIWLQFIWCTTRVIMKQSVLIAAACAAVSMAAPTAQVAERAVKPTVYLAGDSTMALGGGGSGTEGTMRNPNLRPSPVRGLIDSRLG